MRVSRVTRDSEKVPLEGKDPSVGPPAALRAKNLRRFPKHRQAPMGARPSKDQKKAPLPTYP